MKDWCCMHACFLQAFDKFTLSVSLSFSQAVYLTGSYDPEGILGSINSIVMCFFGVQAGRIFIHHKQWGSRMLRFFIWGLLLVSMMREKGREGGKGGESNKGAIERESERGRLRQQKCNQVIYHRVHWVPFCVKVVWMMELYHWIRTYGKLTALMCIIILSFPPF